MDTLTDDILYYLLTRVTQYREHHRLSCVCRTWRRLLTKDPADWAEFAPLLRERLPVLDVPPFRWVHNPVMKNAIVELFQLLCHPVCRPFFREASRHKQSVIEMCRYCWSWNYPYPVNEAACQLATVIGVVADAPLAHASSGW
jgi:hypothetical protein